jgi:hypothetical protein
VVIEVLAVTGIAVKSVVVLAEFVKLRKDLAMYNCR